MMRRYPILSAVLAGLVAGLLGASVLALAGIDNDDEDGLPKLPTASTGAELASDGRAAIAPAGPIEYRVAGTLDDLPEEGPAYRIGDDGIGRIAVLKEALGIRGDVRTQDEAFVVQDGDRVLRVAAVPGLPWSFGDEQCGPDTAVSSDGTFACGRAVPEIACDMPPCPPGQACAQVCPEPVQPEAGPREDAERAAEALFVRLGVEHDAERMIRGFDGWDTTARGEVGGLSVVGLETTATFGPGGRLLRASGHLARPEKIGDYPLVSTEEALSRLRKGTAIGPQPLDGREPALLMIAPEPDGRPMEQVITAVRLGLQFVGGGQDAYLVPAALFRLEGGDEIPVPAVTDEHLADVQPTPEPVPEPVPEPGGIDPAPPPVPGRPGGPGSSGGGSSGQACSGAASAGAPGQPASDVKLELCGPGQARVGEEVVLEATVAPCEGVLDFGDGTSTPVKPGERTRVGHAYSNPGAYTVTFSAPGCGGDARIAHEVTVT